MTGKLESPRSPREALQPVPNRVSLAREFDMMLGVMKDTGYITRELPFATSLNAMTQAQIGSIGRLFDATVERSGSRAPRFTVAIPDSRQAIIITAAAGSDGPTPYEITLMAQWREGGPTCRVEVPIWGSTSGSVAVVRGAGSICFVQRTEEADTYREVTVSKKSTHSMWGREEELLETTDIDRRRSIAKALMLLNSS